MAYFSHPLRRNSILKSLPSGTLLYQSGIITVRETHLDFEKWE